MRPQPLKESARARAPPAQTFGRDRGLSSLCEYPDFRVARHAVVQGVVRIELLGGRSIARRPPGAGPQTPVEAESSSVVDVEREAGQVGGAARRPARRHDG